MTDSIKYPDPETYPDPDARWYIKNSVFFPDAAGTLPAHLSRNGAEIPYTYQQLRERWPEGIPWSAVERVKAFPAAEISYQPVNLGAVDWSANRIAMRLENNITTTGNTFTFPIITNTTS